MKSAHTFATGSGPVAGVDCCLSLVFVPIGMPYQKLMPIFRSPGAATKVRRILGLLVGSASLGSALSGFAVVARRRCLSKRQSDSRSFPAFLALGMIIFAFIRASRCSRSAGFILVIGVASGLFLTLDQRLALDTDSRRIARAHDEPVGYGLGSDSFDDAGSGHGRRISWNISVVLAVAGCLRDSATCITLLGNGVHRLLDL